MQMTDVELSTTYIICNILNKKVLKITNVNSNTPLIYIPIFYISCNGNNGKIEYAIDSENKCVRIFLNNNFKCTVSNELLDNIAFKLQCCIIKREFNSTFQAELYEFAEKIQCMKVNLNDGFILQIHNVFTNQTQKWKFFIKYYINNTPTLLDTNEFTKFIFKIKYCNESVMNRVNSIKTKEKIFDRINCLMKSGCTLEYNSVECESLKKNLQKVDSLMPDIVAEMLLKYYSTRIGKLSNIAEILENEDCLRMSNEGYYSYKIKMMLRAFALGMNPSSQWDGKEDMNGGYIIVKENGDTTCFSPYNRNEFEEYLLNSTEFERFSTNRCDDMIIYKNEEDYFIKLSLQIKFVKTGC